MPDQGANAHGVVKAADLWETVGMTNQQTNQQILPLHREDYKVQKLMMRVELKLALQAKAAREAQQTDAKN